MGVVKKAVSVLTGGLVGGDKPKAEPAPAPETPKDATTAATTDAQTTQAEEEKKKAAKLVALNAGSSSSALGVSGQPSTTKRNLLGL